MHSQNGGEHGLAPVTQLFPREAAWRTTWDDVADDDDDEYDGGLSDDDGYDACGAIEREIAETNLLKRLRTRQLSVAEARVVVAERDLTSGDVEDVLAGFCRRGYLDDARLAEQLIHAAVDRRGQGRRVIAQTLVKRGIPRDVVDVALAELPDDDAERALDFARTKARSMASLDRATAERRLAGQLARRGYDNALAAAREALDEVEGVAATVRFHP